MRVRLLGTGASERLARPVVRLRVLRRRRGGQGVLRGQTGVLVDDRLLLDLGPELPRAALRQGTDARGRRGGPGHARARGPLRSRRR